MPILRVRTGCLTCRRRKKKCDEIRPICTGCARNQLSCSWPQKNHPAGGGARRASSAASPAARPSHTEPAPYDPSLDPHHVSLPHDAQDLLFSISPGSAFVAAALAQCVSPLLVDSGGGDANAGRDPRAIVGPISPDSSSSATSTAARPRHLEDDDRQQHHDFPDVPQDPFSPSHLSAAFDVPELPAAEFTDAGHVFDDLAGAPSFSGEVSQVPRGMSLLPGMGSGSFELLSHYMSVTSRSMGNGSTADNPFDVQLIPLAFGSDLILHLILTQSAVHRATRMLGSGDSAASTHYHQSLQLFNRSLTRCTEGSAPELSTLAAGALILCFVETAKGDVHGRVFDHLISAHPLLQRLLSQKTNAPPRQLLDFLVEYYVYTATLSIVSIDCRVGPQFLLSESLEAYAHTLISRGYVGSLCGCWLELLLHIPVIFQIGRRFLAEGEASRPINADDFSLFAHVQASIKNWAPSTELRPDVALAGRIYQQAMLLYLYTALAPISGAGGGDTGGTHGAAVAEALDHAFEHLERLAMDARINTSLCWPIVVIGSCVADGEERRALLRTRLDVMFATIGLGNIRQTGALLEQIWKVPGVNPWSVCQVMLDSQIWISFA